MHGFEAGINRVVIKKIFRRHIAVFRADCAILEEKLFWVSAEN